MKKGIAFGALLLATSASLTMASPIGSAPIEIGGVTYAATGSVETVIAPFTSPSTATTGTYAGLVEVVITGTGFSAGSTLNDAFYLFSSGIGRDGQYYQMNIGWTGAPLAPFSGEARNLDQYVRWMETVGEIGSINQLPYVPSHEYHLVLDVPEASSLLFFGVSDGNFGDNGGAYTIQVQQLGSVPEPTSVALMGLGALGLLGVSLRRRKRA